MSVYDRASEGGISIRQKTQKAESSKGGKLKRQKLKRPKKVGAGK